MADSQAFLNSINQFKQSIDTRKTIISEFEEPFFKFTQEFDILPESCPPLIMDAFIACLSETARFHPGTQRSLRAVDWFLHYLKNDAKLFARFHPKREWLRQINLATYFDQSGSNIALDFACFLLRYHKFLSIHDFTEDPGARQRIKRAEQQRFWNDIEDLTKAHETFVSEFERHQSSTASAFTEIFEHVENIRKFAESTNTEITEKMSTIRNDMMGFQGDMRTMRVSQQGLNASQPTPTQSKDVQILDTELQQRLVALENSLINRMQSLEVQVERSMSKVNYIESKVDLDKTKTGKMEQHINEHQSLIQKMGQKILTQHDKSEEFKRLTVAKFSKFESEFVTANVKPGEASSAQVPVDTIMVNRIGDLEAQVSSLVHETASLRQASKPETVATKTENVTVKVDDFELSIMKQRMDQLEINIQEVRRAQTSTRLSLNEPPPQTPTEPADVPKLTQAWAESVRKDLSQEFAQTLDIHSTGLYAEIDRLRDNLEKQRPSGQPSHTTLPAFDKEYSAELAKLHDNFNKLQSEIGNLRLENRTEQNTIPTDINKVWDFFKNYVHQQAYNHFKYVQLNENITTREKMDAMDWLIRNIQFISANVAFDLIGKFRDMLIQGIETKNQIVFTRHSSDVMYNLLDMIKSRSWTDMIDPQGISKQVLLYHCLEILLLSDFNLQQALTVRLVEIIIDELGIQSERTMLQTFMLRCLANAARSDVAGDRLADCNGILELVRITKDFPEEEIVANSYKTIRAMLRTNRNLEVVHMVTKGSLLEDMLLILASFGHSPAILEEACGAIRNYCKIIESIKVAPSKLTKLIQIATDPLQQRHSLLARGALQALGSKEIYRNYIEQIGGNDALRGAVI